MSVDYQHNETRTLSVTGVSSTKVSPDQLSISIAVETQARIAFAAAQANAENTSKVIAALERARVNEPEIDTSQYSIYPFYDYANTSDDCAKYGSQLGYCPPVLKRIPAGPGRSTRS